MKRTIAVLLSIIMCIGTMAFAIPAGAETEYNLFSDATYTYTLSEDIDFWNECTDTGRTCLTDGAFRRTSGNVAFNDIYSVPGTTVEIGAYGTTVIEFTLASPALLEKLIIRSARRSGNRYLNIVFVETAPVDGNYTAATYTESAVAIEGAPKHDGADQYFDITVAFTNMLTKAAKVRITLNTYDGYEEQFILSFDEIEAYGPKTVDSDEEPSEEVSFDYEVSEDYEVSHEESSDIEVSEEISDESSEEVSDGEGDSSGFYTPVNYENMKGVWLFQYYTSGGMFKSGTSQRSESSYRQYVQTVVDNMVKDGFNTVMLQMRPYGDSLYPSQYFSPSPYAISGTSYGGTNSSFAYDPLEIFLEIAHEKDISVHAWLNPMRLMSSSQLSAVNSQFTLKQWYNDSSKNGTYIVNVSGKYYLNPAYPEARQLIIDGVMEICENYDIDGIHFDDYFYVSIDSESTDLAFDQKAFNLYGSSYGASYSLSVRKEFRRQQVNTLLRDIYSAMHEYNDDLIFGISPAGNIDNNQTGYLCADVRTWCSTPGYVDYICPQIYWSFDHYLDYAKFDVCTENWADMCTTDEVDLVIGIPAYRAENNASYSSTDPGWYNRKDNIARMINYVNSHPTAKGYVFFKYESTYDIYTGEYNTAFSQEINNYIGLVSINKGGTASGTTGECTWTLNDTVLTISGNGAMGNYYYLNTYIPWGTHVTEVIISDGVTSIGNYAFYNCTSLKSVSIGNSVESIGNHAFYKCTSLESVTIPNSVISIGEDVFRSCTSLASITLGSGVTSIGDYAFSSCSSLETVYYSGDSEEWSKISIGSYNTYLTDATRVYGTVNPGGTRSGITGDCTWTLDGTVLTISGNGAIKNYTTIYPAPWGADITEVIISDGVTNIGEYAFALCESLKSITIPDSVTSIGDFALAGCYALTSITIPNSVTSIGADAFYNCYNLTSISIGNGVTSIGCGAFESCTTFNTVYYDGDSEGWSKISIGSNNAILTNATRIYGTPNPDGTISGTTGDCTWTLNGTALTISGNGAVKNYTESYPAPWGTDITRVIISNGVTRVGNFAFYGCKILKIIILPDSIASIGVSAFYDTLYYNDTSNWENDVLYIANCLIQAKGTISGEYTVKSGTLTIADEAFYNCSSLASIAIPDSVTNIGDYAFYKSTSLKSVTIPNGVTSIGYRAFSDCTNLESITIPVGVTSIGDHAFYNCTKLESITIPAGLTSIGDYAFYNCTSLKSITIPVGLTSIGDHAFYDCTNIKTVYYGGDPAEWNKISIGSGNEPLTNATRICGTVNPDGTISGTTGDCTWVLDGTVLTVSGNGAMGDYSSSDIVPYGTNITKVIVSDGVTNIGDNAFEYCKDLKSVTVGNGVKSIGDFAFCYCTSLESITISAGTTSIGVYAFYGCSSLDTVNYGGNEEVWSDIQIGSGNTPLTNASIVFGYTPDSDEHFEFAESADTTNIVKSEVTTNLYFKAGGVSGADLKALFNDADVTITKANGTAIADTAKVGTGATITSTVNGVSQTLTVVVLGDVTGDGVVNGIDYAQILLSAKGKKQIDDTAKLQAANVNGAKADGSVSSTDINGIDYAQVLLMSKGRRASFNTQVK